MESSRGLAGTRSAPAGAQALQALQLQFLQHQQQQQQQHHHQQQQSAWLQQQQQQAAAAHQQLSQQGGGAGTHPAAVGQQGALTQPGFLAGHAHGLNLAAPGVHAFLRAFQMSPRPSAQVSPGGAVSAAMSAQSTAGGGHADGAAMMHAARLHAEAMQQQQQQQQYQYQQQQHALASRAAAQYAAQQPGTAGSASASPRAPVGHPTGHAIDPIIVAAQKALAAHRLAPECCSTDGLDSGSNSVATTPRAAAATGGARATQQHAAAAAAAAAGLVAAAAARVAQSAPAAAAAASGGGGGGGSAGGAHMAHAGDAPGELMAGDTAAMAAANVTNAAIRAAEACPGGGPDNDTIAVVAGSLRGWYSNSRGKILPVRLTRHQLEQHPHSACAQLMKALKNPTTAPEEEWLQRTIFVRAAGFKTLKHGADSVINLIQPDGNKGITLMALFRRIKRHQARLEQQLTPLQGGYNPTLSDASELYSSSRATDMEGSPEASSAAAAAAAGCGSDWQSASATSSHQECADVVPDIVAVCCNGIRGWYSSRRDKVLPEQQPQQRLNLLLNLSDEGLLHADHNGMQQLTPANAPEAAWLSRSGFVKLAGLASSDISGTAIRLLQADGSIGHTLSTFVRFKADSSMQQQLAAHRRSSRLSVMKLASDFPDPLPGSQGGYDGGGAASGGAGTAGNSGSGAAAAGAGDGGGARAAMEDFSAEAGGDSFVGVVVEVMCGAVHGWYCSARDRILPDALVRERLQQQPPPPLAPEPQQVAAAAAAAGEPQQAAEGGEGAAPPSPAQPMAAAVATEAQLAVINAAPYGAWVSKTGFMKLAPVHCWKCDSNKAIKLLSADGKSVGLTLGTFIKHERRRLYDRKDVLLAPAAPPLSQDNDAAAGQRNASGPTSSQLQQQQQQQRPLGSDAPARSFRSLREQQQPGSPWSSDVGGAGPFGGALLDGGGGGNDSTATGAGGGTASDADTDNTAAARRASARVMSQAAAINEAAGSQEQQGVSAVMVPVMCGCMNGWYHMTRDVVLPLSKRQDVPGWQRQAPPNPADVPDNAWVIKLVFKKMGGMQHQHDALKSIKLVQPDGSMGITLATHLKRERDASARRQQEELGATAAATDTRARSRRRQCAVALEGSSAADYHYYDHVHTDTPDPEYRPIKKQRRKPGAAGGALEQQAAARAHAAHKRALAFIAAAVAAAAAADDDCDGPDAVYGSACVDDQAGGTPPAPLPAAAAAGASNAGNGAAAGGGADIAGAAAGDIVVPVVCGVARGWFSSSKDQVLLQPQLAGLLKQQLEAGRAESEEADDSESAGAAADGRFGQSSAAQAAADEAEAAQYPHLAAHELLALPAELLARPGSSLLWVSKRAFQKLGGMRHQNDAHQAMKVLLPDGSAGVALATYLCREAEQRQQQAAAAAQPALRRQQQGQQAWLDALVAATDAIGVSVPEQGSPGDDDAAAPMYAAAAAEAAAAMGEQRQSSTGAPAPLFTSPVVDMDTDCTEQEGVAAAEAVLAAFKGSTSTGMAYPDACAAATGIAVPSLAAIATAAAHSSASNTRHHVDAFGSFVAGSSSTDFDAQRHKAMLQQAHGAHAAAAGAIAAGSSSAAVAAGHNGCAVPARITAGSSSSSSYDAAAM